MAEVFIVSIMHFLKYFSSDWSRDWTKNKQQFLQSPNKFLEKEVAVFLVFTISLTVFELTDFPLIEQLKEFGYLTDGYWGDFHSNSFSFRLTLHLYTWAGVVVVVVVVVGVVVEVVEVVGLIVVVFFSGDELGLGVVVPIL